MAKPRIVCLRSIAENAPSRSVEARGRVRYAVQVFAYLSQSPGEDGGFAIVTDRFLCLLGRATTAVQASELYVALDSDSVHLDSALTRMIDHYALKDFAIVEVLDPSARRMTVAVQGDVVADVEGATGTRLSGPTGATWVMGEVKGVTALALSLAGIPDHVGHERLPLRRGVVRAAMVALNDAASSVPAFVDEPAPKTVQIDVPEVAHGTAPDTAPDPAPGISPSTDGTRPISRAERSALRIDLPAEVAVRRLGVQLSDGNPFAANIPLVLGRRPWSTELDTSSIVSIALESPEREISAIHLEIAEIAGRLRARDLNSTNGTVIMSPGKPSWLLTHGLDTILGDGDVLDLGEGAFVKIVAL